MPEYLFKCGKCKKEFTEILPFSQLDNEVICNCPKCSANITMEEKLINFQGVVSMNSSAFSIAKKKYGNKAGGPTAIVNGKDTGKRAKW